jgi:hypothetical protein
VRSGIPTATVLLVSCWLAATAGVPGSVVRHAASCVGANPDVQIGTVPPWGGLRLVGGAGGASRDDDHTEEGTDRVDEGDRYDLSFRTRSDVSDVRERHGGAGGRGAAPFSFRALVNQRKGLPPTEEPASSAELDDDSEWNEAPDAALAAAEPLLLQPGDGASALQLCASGRALLARGRAEEALALFDRAAAADRALHDAWHGRAAALLETPAVAGGSARAPGALRDAARALDAALALKPNLQDALCLYPPRPLSY